MDAPSNANIAQYYDMSQKYYCRFWSPTGLHYGFWYPDTKCLEEAIGNTNYFCMKALGITSGDVVLDAGCGVGGTCRYLASRTGARVHGVTLSRVQAAMAQQCAQREGIAHLARTTIQDFSNTAFKEDSFSKVLGIESICHAASKDRFLREAYRIMKPGGRIAVIDAFLRHNMLNSREQHIYRRVTEGWVLSSLPSIADFYSALYRCGFSKVGFCNLQNLVEKSVDRIYLWSWLRWPVNFISARLGIGRENQAARYQKALFRRNLAVYGAFFAQKPL